MREGRLGYNYENGRYGLLSMDLWIDTGFHCGIALLDPPYHHGTVAKALPQLAAHMASGGVVLCETELDAELPEQVEGLVLAKQYKYGKILVSRYEKEEQL